jgi:benzil reductase ((S)-benzoin forming)
MQTYIVVGVSTGIGYELVNLLLKQGKKVIGIGRNNTHRDACYKYMSLDLSKAKDVEAFDFPKITEPFAFIYNAGTLGHIAAFEEQEIENASNVMQVNYLSATTLTHKILRNNLCQQIQYISSGAAHRAIASWSQYCASKAALNIFAETLQLELRTASKNCNIYSIAPGVVDTPMQATIRRCSEQDFPQVKQFQNMFDNQELTSPSEIAQKLYCILHHPEEFAAVCVSLRDIRL